MRTVSFSKPTAQRFLNEKFVNTYTNTEGDPTSGKSIWHQPRDPSGSCIRGNGKQNVQILFLTPQGEIFHVATGFLSGKDLLAEARFAADLFDKLKNPSQDPIQIVSKSHQDRLEADGFSNEEINSNNPMARMMAQFQLPGMGDFTMGLNLDPPQRQPRNERNDRDLFESMINQQYISDNQFPIRHPLMSWEQLQRDPTPLVGNGRSFFSSSSSGSQR